MLVTRNEDTFYEVGPVGPAGSRYNSSMEPEMHRERAAPDGVAGVANKLL